MARAHPQLEVRKRTDTGKGAARRIRREGRIPGVFYTHGEEAVPVEVDDRAFRAFLRNEGRSSLLELNSKAKKLGGQYALVREVQTDPVKQFVLHVDLQGVELKEKVTVQVPIEFVGEPAGLKEGGSEEVHFYELEVVSRADQIPDEIRVDVSEMQIGDVLHAGDLSLPKGVELGIDDDIAIMHVEERRGMMEEKAEEEAAAAEEGAEEGAEEESEEGAEGESGSDEEPEDE